MGDNSDEVCAVCGKIGRTNSKRQVCCRCGKTYHTACAKVLTVLDKNGKSVLACSPCLAEVNAPRTRSSSVGSPAAMKDVSKLRSLNTSTASVLGEENSRGGDAMKAIIERLQRLDDDFVARNEANEKRMEEWFVNMETKFDTKLQEIQSCISVLDQLPSLFERISANEMMIADIVEDQKNIRSLVEESRSAMSSSAADVNLKQLKAANKSLSQKVSRLSARQVQLSQDLVISGLRYERTADLRLLSVAVLKAVCPEFQERDIVQMRPLISKRATTEPPDGIPSRSHPIVVTLSSALVRVTIQAKVKAGKLHTIAMDSDLMKKAGSMASHAGLVNISKFLPLEVHQLRIIVRQKAKEKSFTTFLRNGELYALWKDEDQAYLIATEEDLNDFLILD